MTEIMLWVSSVWLLGSALFLIFRVFFPDAEPMQFSSLEDGAELFELKDALVGVALGSLVLAAVAIWILTTIPGTTDHPKPQYAVTQ